MKIKNISQYRTFYKDKIRDLPNRDEHFMGTYFEENKNKQYGWFEIYHGDKEGYGKAEEGIGNFLSSFLDMAKDGQAVYEFLQNAVDAGASHFTMAWGKDEVDGNNYLLVANNGDMFNFDSVRSILNVGSSTKTADSQNIGKFGIGFKLAHRLVGKDNGLEELLSHNNPSGPILFSWQNGELGELASGENPEPESIKIEEVEKGNYLITDKNAWLFKILITCFPALPQNQTISENIRLSDGTKAPSPVFNSSEYNALSRWVKRYRKYLTDDRYKEGALFFIKLGTGKENDLTDKNLAEGVRFSLAILQETAEDNVRKNKTLKTVQLNQNEPIKKPTLNYHFLKIEKSKHLKEYIYIRFGVNNKDELTNEQKSKLNQESDIEVLFGFRDYDKMEDYFKGAPNFYLYFPLSEEVHNFNFVLHSNAFYKASSRTFLHKGTTGEDGINERLLRTIAKRLEEELLK
ncbi:MAG: ATP-binding protein, partial [Bacteroidales bacterium]